MNKYLVVIYFLVGLILMQSDLQVFLLYITVLPIHLFFLLIAIRKNILPLFFLSFLSFLALGVNPIFFFLEKSQYSISGWNAVGNFDFTFSKYFTYYSFFLLFISVVFIIVLLFNKKLFKQPFFLYVKGLFVQLGKNHNKNSTGYLIILCIISIFLTLFMFNFRIGIRGIKPYALPFHLSGILYYFRMIPLSAVMIYLYIKSNKKTISIIFVYLYLLFAGPTSASRSLIAFLLLPIAVYDYLTNRKKTFLFSCAYFAFLYIIITISRSFLYDYYLASSHLVTFDELYDLSLADSLPLDFSIIYNFLSQFTGRLFGAQSLVLGGEFHNTGFNDLLSYYIFGSNIDTVVGGLASEVYGINLPEDMAFGVGLGLPGTIVLLSSNNYLYAFVQSLIISLIFIKTNNDIQRILSGFLSPIVKFTSLILLVSMVYLLWSRSSMYLVYLHVFILWFIANKFRYIKSILLKVE